MCVSRKHMHRNAQCEVCVCSKTCSVWAPELGMSAHAGRGTRVNVCVSSSTCVRILECMSA